MLILKSSRRVMSCRGVNIEAYDNINLQNFKSEGRPAFSSYFYER